MGVCPVDSPSLQFLEPIGFEQVIGPVGGVVDELTAVLDALADDDLHALGDGALLDRTAVLVAARNRIDAELARTVRAADVRQASEQDGLKTMASWLRGHGRLSPRAAAQLVRSGRALQHLPAVGAALAAGDLTAEQVAGIAPRRKRGG